MIERIRQLLRGWGMPPLETSSLHQKAVLWVNSGRKTRDGRPTVNAAVEIKCRWEKVRKQVLTGNGTVVGTVATVVVDREIADGSILWQGELLDWYGTGSGHHVGGLFEVVSYDETPDVKGREVNREVGLIRRGDALPAVV